MKLTDAQLNLLREVEKVPRYVATYYSPAQVLVRLGLAEWKGDKLEITDEGRKVLCSPTK